MLLRYYVTMIMLSLVCVQTKAAAVTAIPIITATAIFYVNDDDKQKHCRENNFPRSFSTISFQLVTALYLVSGNVSL